MSEGSGDRDHNPSKKASRALIAATVVAIVAAIAGFALYATARVPDGSAAKVNGGYLAEADVDSYIAQYRMSHQLTDDAALAKALSSQGMSVAQFRINAIDQLAIADLVEARAKELGVSADESKVDAQIASLKSSLAFNDDSIWQRTLQQYGMTEDQLRAQYRASLLQRTVCEKDVARREATDAEALSYAKSQLAGSSQKHYTRIAFTGDGAEEKARGFSGDLAKYLAARSFANARAQAEDVRARAERAGAELSSYAWTMGLSSDDGLAQDLSDLDVGDTSGVRDDADAGSASIYLCDDEYAFPASKAIGSLKESDVPGTLWSAVRDKAADSLWNSDCSAYVAKLLAQAKVTYYPVPDGADYNVELPGTASSDSAQKNASNSEAGASN